MQEEFYEIVLTWVWTLRARRRSAYLGRREFLMEWFTALAWIYAKTRNVKRRALPYNINNPAIIDRRDNSPSHFIIHPS